MKKTKKNKKAARLSGRFQRFLGTLLFVIFGSGTGFSQTPAQQTSSTDPQAYALFDAQGHRISFSEMVSGLAEADVVLVGEIHNCCITHWLELEITRALHRIHGDRLMMGAEMFEADNQLLLDEYMQRTIRYDSFEDEARLWPNYQTDYAPLVFYAKEHSIPFVATNVPRRYANVVKYKGLAFLDSLSDEAKRYLPPLPITFQADDDQENLFALMHAVGKGQGEKSFLAEAQALKDATMGWFIARRMQHKFLHFNGNYHSDFKKGLVPYLLEYRPGTTVKTVCSVRQETVKLLDEEHKGRADYYICVLEDMSSSY